MKEKTVLSMVLLGFIRRGDVQAKACKLTVESDMRR